MSQKSILNYFSKTPKRSPSTGPGPSALLLTPSAPKAPIKTLSPKAPTPNGTRQKRAPSADPFLTPEAQGKVKRPKTDDASRESILNIDKE